MENKNDRGEVTKVKAKRSEAQAHSSKKDYSTTDGEKEEEVDGR